MGNTEYQVILRFRWSLPIRMTFSSRTLEELIQGRSAAYRKLVEAYVLAAVDIGSTEKMNNYLVGVVALRN
jgi:hypothetical protein